MTLSELFDKANEMVAKRYPDHNASIKEMNSYRDVYIHGMTEKLKEWLKHQIHLIGSIKTISITGSYWKRTCYWCNRIKHLLKEYGK